MLNNKLTKEIIGGQLRDDLPEFTSGDTIRVDVKINEGEKVRIQSFEGVVIKTQGSGISFSVVVRKNSNGVFVERTFPLHSPIIDKVEVIKRGRVRRARIYYIRKLSGKSARIKEIVVSKKETNQTNKVDNKKDVKTKTKNVKKNVEVKTDNKKDVKKTEKTDK